MKTGEFANENPASYVAPVDKQGQPRVRGFLMWFADKTGFYFHTGTMKPVYNQWKVNPEVEVRFFNQKREGGIMIRIADEIEFLNDLELKQN